MSKPIYGIRNCAVCGTPYKNSHEREKCCSLACGHELRRRHFRENAERCLGEPLKAGIERRLASGDSMQSIAGACGFTDTRALHRLMAELEIPRRSKSESIRLQWRDNAIRRTNWGQTISEWKRAHPKEAIEHSLIGNVALQNTSPTTLELRMMGILDELGISYQFQYVVGGKFLCDFYVPEFNLIIEVDGDYWHSTPKQRRRDVSKDAYLQACGFSVLRISEQTLGSPTLLNQLRAKML